MTTQNAYKSTKQEAEARIEKMYAEVSILNNAAKRMIDELDDSQESELIINAVECQVGRLLERIAVEIKTVDHCNSYLD